MDILESETSTNVAEDEPSNPTTARNGQDGADDSSDDDWHARTWDLFVASAKKGVLTPEEFVPFARELNLDTDVATVRRFMRPEQEGRLTYDAALALLEAIPLGVADDVDDQGTGAGAGADAAEIPLGPIDFIRVRLCGGAPPADVLAGHRYRQAGNDGGDHAAPIRYRLRAPKVSPQFWLIFNASMLFTLTSATVIALIATMWLQTISRVDFFYLERYERLVSAFAASFADNAVLVAQRDLYDQADTFAKWVDREVAGRFDDITDDLRHETVYIRQASQSVAWQTRLLEQERLRLKIGDLPRFLQQTVEIDIVTLRELLDLWERDNSWQSVAFNYDSNFTWHQTALVSTPVDPTALHAVAPCRTVHRASVTSGKATAFETGVAVSFLANRSSGVSSSAPIATIAAAYLQSLGLMVCVALPDAVVRDKAIAAVATALDAVNVENVAAATQQKTWTAEAVVLDIDTAAWSATYRTKLLKSTAACEFLDGRCAGLLQWIVMCIRDYGSTGNNTVGLGYDGTNAVSAFVYLQDFQMAVLLTVDDGWVLGVLREEAIGHINNITLLLGPDANVMMGTRNGSVPVAQATAEKFQDACALPNCSRLPDYDAVVFDAFRTGETQSVVRPDARLVPVLCASAYIPSLELAFTTETPLEASNRRAARSLAAAFDTINQRSGDDQLQLVRPALAPYVKTFDGRVRCPSNVICARNGSFVMFRSDCPACLPVDRALTAQPAKYVTRIDSSRCPTCNRSAFVTQPNANSDLTDSAISTLVSGQRMIEDLPDYGNVEVHAATSPVGNWSAAIIVKVDVEAVREQVLNYVLAFVGAAVALIAIGLALLIYFSQRTLRNMANEGRDIKRGIEADRQKFDEMIDQLVPATVIAQYRARIRCVTTSHVGVSIAFVDIAGFSDMMKAWSPRQTVRTVAYFNHLLHVVAVKFNIYRLRTFGDAAVFLAGIERDGEDVQQQRESVARDAMRTSQFAAYVTQLLSPAFTHYPQRLTQFADQFKNEALDVPMPDIRTRIGLHNGPIHAGMVDVGKTPYFEAYGPSLAIAQRMQATAQPGRVNASATFKELIETVDSAGIFEFDALKKAVVKGRGAISSFPIKSIQLNIDEVLLHQLQIEHAQRMHLFAHKGQAQRVEQSETSSHITGHQQSTNVSDVFERE